MPSLKCSNKTGFTLIEVIAALAILGFLLVGLVMARSRFTNQSVLARHKVEATAIADKLLEDWWKDVNKLPRNSFAELDNAMQWRTRIIDDSTLSDLKAQIVRLEINQTNGVTLKPILFVDVVVPIEPKEQEPNHSR